MKLFRKTAQHEHGFTLIEMLVIAPIVVLAIGAFLTVIISMTGDVLSSRGANALAFNVQDAMNRMEQDVKLSTTFLATNSIALNTGGNQGYNNDDSSNFTNVGGTSGTSLILNELVTNGNPVSTSAGIVYLQNSPNDCASASVVKNTPMTMNVIYYIKPDPTNNNISTLWRRTIMPSNYANGSIRCSTPWQQPSCAPYFNSTTTYTSNICTTNDIQLVSGVAASDFNIQYFTTASATSPNGTATDTGASLAARGAALASSPTVSISINASQSVAGRTITRAATLRATRLDSNASAIASIPAATTPAAPTVNSTTTSPTNAVFSWASVPGATGYTFEYNINGGSWQTGFTNQNTRTYTVAAPYNGAVVNARVTSINSAGNSGYGTNSVTIPLWVPLLLQNNWVYYGSPYTVPAYTKTSDGLILLKGMIKAGTATSGLSIASLPAGYRPANTMMFTTDTNANASSRVDITAAGAVVFQIGSNGWLSLDNIKYEPSTSPYTFTALTLSNSWANFGSGFQPASYTLDGMGRVQIQGVISGGSLTANSVISTLSSTYLPSLYQHLLATSNNALAFIAAAQTNATYPGPGIQYKGGSNAFLSINNMYYSSALPASGSCPAAVSSWCTLTLQNSWAWYSSTGIFATPQYTKSTDGVVTLKGLIQGGGTTSDVTVITTLPAGYRPASRLLFEIVSNGATGRLDILPNGNVVFEAGSSTWISLDNISFIAEQ